MKKKLLSLILAVTMAVSAMSGGITAFAEEEIIESNLMTNVSENDKFRDKDKDKDKGPNKDNNKNTKILAHTKDIAGITGIVVRFDSENMELTSNNDKTWKSPDDGDYVKDQIQGISITVNGEVLDLKEVSSKDSVEQGYFLGTEGNGGSLNIWITGTYPEQDKSDSLPVRDVDLHLSSDLRDAFRRQGRYTVDFFEIHVDGVDSAMTYNGYLNFWNPNTLGKELDYNIYLGTIPNSWTKANAMEEVNQYTGLTAIFPTHSNIWANKGYFGADQLTLRHTFEENGKGWTLHLYFDVFDPDETKDITVHYVNTENQSISEPMSGSVAISVDVAEIESLNGEKIKKEIDNYTFDKKTISGNVITMIYRQAETKPEPEGDVPLNYDANAGTDVVTGLPSAGLIKVDTSVAVATSADMKRQGYTFLGWDENSQANVPTYKANDTQASIFMDAGKTLYAIWEANAPATKSFTITYDANGPEQKTFLDEHKDVEASIENVTVLSNEITKFSYENHTFLGWNTDKDAEAASLNAGAAIEAKEATLYAIWEEDTGKVTVQHQMIIEDAKGVQQGDILNLGTSGETTYSVGTKLVGAGLKLKEYEEYYLSSDPAEWTVTKDSQKTITLTYKRVIPAIVENPVILHIYRTIVNGQIVREDPVPQTSFPNHGQPYKSGDQVTVKDFIAEKDGFTYSECTPEILTLDIDSAKNIATIYYNKALTEVTVNYVDTTGKTIADTLLVSVNAGTKVTDDMMYNNAPIKKAISGYTYQETKAGENTLTLVYAQNVNPPVEEPDNGGSYPSRPTTPGDEIIDEEETPLAPAPSEDEIIIDEEPSLAPAPSDEETIEDEATPLAAAPQTGRTAGGLSLLAIASAAVIVLIKKKYRDD